jgi:hypothetical protein
LLPPDTGLFRGRCLNREASGHDLSRAGFPRLKLRLEARRVKYRRLKAAVCLKGVRGDAC